MDNAFDMEEIQRLAKSPAAQQLAALLRQNSGKELDSAISRAAAGDYSEAKKLISAFLSTPEAKSLVEQIKE